ncbi:LIMLP_19325 family protein [Leptospira noguchii]|uniref:Uncharacterized protein n=1 Tax=Leptospira noguchii serovar Autumnalis str. ZUN142 TaxID=1085540 RepID=M6UC33_9LEPT|nr:hypothetical protein [Leptospira noguchii]EMO42587.1 hypothetical protein LEP1GSC186_3199 [Leptospira noguchii serovar Autumnalis str. ZUN142]UOG32793.1 hypothetical protein MAL06_21090 [Leptospira noguchii]UOG36247.1 hypothetical protein MAL02_19035 [Leptospira noguchii]UOG47210.1 hypothetical protein MAL01_19440 [Leptospira noguchii]UOG62621.1 hypothetical protein MAL07_19690 [Leptospira noguchii]
MVINYFNIKPLDFTESELDEFSRYIGLPLYNEDKEAILKYNSFRKALAIRKRLKFNSLENVSSSDLLN